MTQIHYNKMHQPSLNGDNLMDRTITLPVIGDCVWVNWKDEAAEDDVHIVDIHCKEDVLNIFNPLLAYNVHPYSMDTSDCLEGKGNRDASFTGNVGRIAYRTDDEGAVAIVAFFVHPRFQGKGMAKTILRAGLQIISNYTEVETLVLNAKAHPRSPVPTEVIHNWYKKMGFEEMGVVCKHAGLHLCKHRKIYSQFPANMQRKVRKHGDRLLVMTNGSWNIHKANQIAQFGLLHLLSDWQVHH